MSELSEQDMAAVMDVMHAQQMEQQALREGLIKSIVAE